MDELNKDIEKSSLEILLDFKYNLIGEISPRL